MSKRRTCLYILTLLMSSILVDAAFSAQINFTPALTISEEYTDNLFLDAENKQDDFVTSVGVSLTGESLWRTAGLRLTYAPSFLFHADNSDQDGFRHAVDLVSWVDLSRNTRIDLNNSYLRTIVPNDQSANLQAEQNPLAQPLIQTDANRRGLGEYYTNATNLRLTHNFGASDSVYVAGSYRIYRETDEPAPGTALADYDIVEPTAGITYWFNSDWGFQLDLLYSDRDYAERNDRKQYDGTAKLNRRFSRNLTGFVAYRHTLLDYNDDTLDSDITISLPTIGMTYLLERNTIITVGAGYYFQNFDDATTSDEDGFIIDAQIYKTIPFRRGDINFIGRSGYTINDQGVEDLGLNLFYEGQINASYGFAQNFYGILGCSYRYDKFPNSIPAREDNTIGARAGFSYQALSWMALDLMYRYSDVSSDQVQNEYVENSVMLTINMAPANPFRLN